ncbi:PKD domain-containing protein [Paracrocinitomix mangrovi]|uniref:HYR-like domain-containing protein n=1 Tax=Paracrocinitomix mangrovi TaxID=2862509 RepID=UPI001C8CFA9B|nr:PKD domain-containing protein [Paracrocinitomix mangrovi]UKN01503.1 PKD domain-containing protein [Paracrocinitomix mangrovi]
MIRSLLTFVGVVALAVNSVGQCSNFNAQFPSGTQSTTSNSLTTVTTCQYGGEYASYSVTAGETYTWTTCGDTDFDTQLTLWNTAHTITYAYNDDDCGLQSTITWTATFTGTVDVLLSQFSCNSNSTCMTVQWACTTCGLGGGGGLSQSNGSTNACSGTFTDSGGSGSTYGANELSTFTICPDTPGSMVTLDFTSFNVEGGFDVMCIYDGLTTAAPSFGCYDNNVPMTGTVQATNPDGCLTIFFDSDGSVQLDGWTATVSCTQPCQTVIADANFNPAPALDGVIYLCQGDVVQLNGNGIYPDNNTGYTQSDGTSTFEWTVDGAALPGQNSSFTFNNEGAYIVQLEITDIEGCTNSNDLDQYVYVSTTPIFDGTIGAPDPICLGDQAVFTGVVTPVTYEKFCTQPAFPPLALPDGSGVSYETSVNLDCYSPGQTLTDQFDLLDICVNMEHSYMGDLDIVLTCPSGQSITLVDYPNGGGGTFLGIPVDNDATPNVQGTGFDYCWSPSSNNGTWGQNTGGTLPAGTYESDDPFSGLVGCDMNGDWTITITDNLGSDNGFIFDWSINFDPAILPPAVTFTPTIVSESWMADPSIVSGTNPITVEPTSTGPACYTFVVTDNFGCTYDTTVCITVADGPVLDTIFPVVACDTYTLPAISGINVTAAAAYYSGPGGTGTQYNPGAVITANMTPLYVYDPGIAGCDDETFFNIIIDNTDPIINCPGALTAVCSIAEQPPYLTFAAFTGAGGSASDDYNLDVNSFTLLSEVSNGQTCPEVVTRTYEIADSCGHTATCTQTITIDDNINPTGTAPANVTVQCSADVPAANPASITDEADNCGIQSVIHLSDVSSGTTCPEVITRTYRITDLCNNFIDVVQTITVDDNINPTGTAPADITVQCSADVPAANPALITDEADNCGIQSVVHLSDVSSGTTCPEVITRTYRITDLCNNFIDVVQTITVDDNINPTGTAPADITVQCSADVPAANPALITDEADNCGIQSVVHLSDVSSGTTCPEVITRTYRITDLCNNFIDVVQTITVDDNINPTGTAPVNVTVQCMADVPAVDINAITDEADNCSVPTVTHISDVQSAGTCPITIDRTYRIEDACGNFIDVVQTITVNDNILPTGTAPANVTVQCMADVPVVDINAITDEADNCSVPTVTHISDVQSAGSCPVTIDRTYRIEDDCGNFIDVVQTITVNDNINPTGTAPADVNVQCAADAPPVDINAITDEADNCSVPTVTHISDVSSGTTCPEVITRTYRIEDACGNFIDVVQTITIDDDIAPTGTAPVNVNVQCMTDVPPVDINAITDEADNCSVPTVTHISDVQSAGTCPITIDRTYRIEDACGNFIDVVQTITVNDNIAPTGTAPGNLTVECATDVPAADPLLITDEADNCTANPAVIHLSDVSSGTTCPEVITRTYRITDDCGNITDLVQTITIDDVTPPVGTAPGAVTVECVGDVPVADPASVTGVSDNCTANPAVNFVSDVSSGTTCPEVITRTYEIIDDCGNTTTVTQTITIDDTTPPTASNPADINIAGGNPVPAPDVNVVTDEADNCGVPVVAFVSDVTDNGVCPETITRTYSVTDACGNTINVVQLIIIGDAILPTASNPLPVNVECIADVPAPDPLVVTDEADNGAVPTVAWVSDASDGNTCPEVITRTYSVTDDCGNVIFVTQTITVDDVTDPTGTAPADVTVECIADVPAVDVNAITDEADNCTVNPTVTHMGDASDGNTCPEIITRTYRIEDECGNFIDVIQTITVDDITNPTGTAPADVTVECIADVPAVDVNAITDEADNCTVNPTVTHMGDASDGNTCPEIITRTYRIEDECGNFIDVIQTITVDDITNPTGTAPADVTVECIADVPAVDVNAITDEADNCTVNPTVTHMGDASDGNTCPEIITRTYRIEDECGNFIDVIQTITVDDITNPTGTAPADVTVECIGDVPAVDVNAITDEADNCTVNPTVTHMGDVSDGNTCPEIITRTYRIEDECGNFIDVNQTITVDDITNPTGTAPADVTVECIGDVPAVDVNAITDEADNCTVNPTVTHMGDVSDGNTCPEIITRTYRIEDECGNFIDVIQTITVDDVTDPTGTAPADVTVECIGDVPAVDVNAITDEADNCTVNPTVTHMGDVSDGNTCPEIITRTYRIEDECGNFIDVIQTITVDDITPPLGTAPGAIAVECSADVPAADPVLVTGVSDNCTANPTVNFVGDASDGNTCPEVITRTYEVVDDCGNTTTLTQTITVDDVTNPTASNPATTTVPGGPAPAPDPAVVIDEADNCTANPVVAFVSQVSDNNPCPETITYTYSVTDDCGNQIFVTHDVLITDPILPTGTAPADITVECIGDVPAADPALITDEADNNGVPTVAHVGDVSDGQSCPETITRTYSITDLCGNVVTVDQIITVNDITAPTASNPAAVVVECIADVPAVDVAVVTDEADNCTVNPTVTHVGDASDGNTCPEVITRTYRITDDCGNFVDVFQTITVDDITPPLGTAPAAVTVQCSADVPAADPALVTGVSDNCTANPTVNFVGDASDGNTCPEVITRTYEIVDDCGNTTTVTQTITVDDTTPPTASNPASTTIPGGPAPAPDPNVVIDEADNCTANPVVAFVSQVSDNNPCPETITYTYSVTDDCGNTINVTHDVIITDPILPTGTAPADITVECIGDVPAADPALITDEADNNGVPTVAHVGDVSDGQSCPETITRTYSITDQCGNVITVDQIITVNDITAPTASNPAAVVVECIGDVPAVDVAVVTDEVDNCTVNPTVTHVGDASDGLSCPETITRTYRITDDCGNFVDVFQTITVDDITPPTGTAPAAVNVECIADVPAADPLLITDEADNCTVNPAVTHVGDVSDGQTCPETITRTYRITDDCGNTTDVTQTITVNDITAPTGTAPAAVTVECIGDVPAADPLLITDEADNCTVNPAVTHVGDVSDGQTCPETITRTYRITDDCGNTTDVTQTITVNDITPPTGTAPAAVAVECIADVPAADPLLITDEADNCTVNPAVTHVGDVSDGNTCPETITRTYRITDDCGNTTDVTQTITVNDITNPTGTAPANVVVQCIGDVPAADINAITDEADNCTVNPVVTHVGDNMVGNGCPTDIFRTYRITDDCGNFIEVVQTITVNDDIAPTGTAPADVTVQCIGDVPAVDVTAITDEADNCTVNPTVTHVSDVSDGNTCPETISRTYRITDDCGNTTDVVQTITVDDTTPPTASNPTSVVVECIGDVPAVDITVVTDEADNCTAAPVVAHVSDVSDGNTCPETITRTYSVTDDCGNSIDVTQTIIVNDITAPTASNPAPITVSCASDVPVADITVVTDEADNCTAAPVVAHVSDVSNGNVCNGEIITRTYSVTDDCGNTINVTQEIHIDAATPSVDAGLSQVVCEGDAVTLTASNPDNAQISWDNGVLDGISFIPPVGNNTYTVVASVCNGECFSDDQVNVNVNPTPQIQFEADNFMGCAPFTVTFTNLSTEQFDCNWEFGDGGASNTCGPVSYTYNNSGMFDVTLTVTSQAGCTASDTYNSYIEVVEPPVADFTMTPSFTDINNTEVEFTNTSLYADTYNWSFGDNLTSNQENPTHNFPEIAGSYTVTLTATNNIGCVSETTAVMTIEDVLLFYVPNIFTPDGDQFNEQFTPVFTSGYDPYDYHLTIFNRWGEIIFESYNAAYGWNGHYGNGGLVEDGVYVWQIEFKETMSDKKHKYRGHVSVLK